MPHWPSKTVTSRLIKYIKSIKGESMLEESLSPPACQTQMQFLTP